MKTGDLWLIFFLAVLAFALIAYVFSKRQEEDRERRKTQAVQRERLEELQRQRKREQQELERRQQEHLEQQRQQLLEPERLQEFERTEPEKRALDASLNQTSRGSIPESVRNEVWRRDRGRCAICGSNENLEFNLINPGSEDGSFATRNLHLLCKNCKWSVGASI